MYAPVANHCYPICIWNQRIMRIDLGKNLPEQKKTYTSAASDASDKSHACEKVKFIFQARKKAQEPMWHQKLSGSDNKVRPLSHTTVPFKKINLTFGEF